MTLLLTLLMMQAAPPAASAPTADDIVVVGERLKRLRMRTRIDRKTGITRCVFKRRSGDPGLDDAACTAVLACVAKIRTEQELEPCLQPAMTALVRNTQWSAGAVRGGR